MIMLLLSPTKCKLEGIIGDDIARNKLKMGKNLGSLGKNNSFKHIRLILFIAPKKSRNICLVLCQCLGGVTGDDK